MYCRERVRAWPHNQYEYLPERCIERAHGSPEDVCSIRLNEQYVIIPPGSDRKRTTNSPRGRRHGCMSKSKFRITWARQFARGMSGRGIATAGQRSRSQQ